MNKKVLTLGIASTLVLGGFALAGLTDSEITITPPTKEIDARQVAFKYTDDNKGEDLIIYSDQSAYKTKTQTAVKVSITNKSGKDQNVKVQAQFKDPKRNTISISEITNTKLNEHTETIKVIEPVLDEKTQQMVPTAVDKTITVYTSERIEKPLTSATEAADPKLALEYKDSGASVFIPIDGTVFLEMIIDIGDERNMDSFSPPEEFYVEAIGDNGAYGILDPSIAYGQVKGGQNAAMAFASSVTSGNVVAVLISWNSATITLSSVAAACVSSGLTLANNPTTDATNSFRAAWAYGVADSTNTCTITPTFSSGPSVYDMIAHEVSGNSSAPFEASTIAVVAAAGTGADAYTSGNITTASNGDYIMGVVTDMNINDVYTTGTGYTGRQTTVAAATGASESEDQIQTSAGNIAATFTNSSGFQYSFVGAIAFQDANAAVQLRQTHFGFYADGTESGSTALAAEDTNITRPTLTTTQVRLQASTTGDLTSNAFQLEWKLSSDNWWTKATTTANRYATTTYLGKGTYTSNAAALSVPFYTGYAAGDIAILCATTDNQDITTPTGWTELASSPQGTGTAGVVSSVRLEAFYKVVQATESNVTVADAGGYNIAQIYGFRGVSTTTPIQVTAGSVETASTTSMSWPSVTTTTTGTSVLLCAAMNDDEADTTNSTGEANANLTGLMEAHDQTVTTGTGGGLVTLVASSSRAQAIGATTATGDLSGRHAYIAIAFNPIIHKFVLSPSADITASGENTTARLSVPGGKTFTAGRIQDDENPADAVDIGASGYSEWVWSIEATSDAATSDVYQFRLTRGGTALTVYDLYPQWTIGTPAAGGGGGGVFQDIIWFE